MSSNESRDFEKRVDDEAEIEEQAPQNERIDMAAIASLSTSQFMAAAMGASGKEESDPFEPQTNPEDVLIPIVEPIVPADSQEERIIPDVPVISLDDEPESSPAASVDAEEAESFGVLNDDVDEGDEEEPCDEQELVPAASGASQYSRANATYEHRKSSKKGIVIAIVVVLAIILGIAGGVAMAFWQNAREAAHIDDRIKEFLTPAETEIDPYWMLILGSDSRAESVDRARSDVMMLCRIDPQAPSVTMVSFPRDTKVYIEGYGTQKINAAYALGGAELAIKTVEDYSGVKISHYAEIYFSGLEDLVDKLGGVTVDVPEHCKYSDVELQPGVQQLTGHEALIFARCRKTYSEGDFTRTKCQRILVKAMVEKVLAQPTANLPTVLQSATQCFATDMELEDLVALAKKMQGMSSEDFYSAMAPSTTGMVDGVSYTFTYINQWKLLMQRAVAGEDPTVSPEEAEICGYAATNNYDLDMAAGLPEDVQERLQQYWDEQAAKAAEEKRAELEKQGSGNKSAEDSSK